MTEEGIGLNLPHPFRHPGCIQGMPVVFRERGFRFHFYSDEGNPREPVHIHASRPGADAKFWLYPEVRLAYNRGYDAKTRNALKRTVEARRQEIEDAWYEHFS